MVMSAEDAVATAAGLRKTLEADRTEFDILRQYWKGRQPLPAVIPVQAPREVREMARTARVNVISIVIESIVQSMIVEGLRASDQEDDPTITRAWAIWQANGMDRRQFGITRAFTAYGASYMVVLPGRPAPVMRPMSPRALTAVYAPDDDVWPVRALERRDRGRVWRLYDDEAVYDLVAQDGTDVMRMVGDPRAHGAKMNGGPVCPVVRYQDVEDLDLDDEAPDMTPYGGGMVARSQIVAGQVAPLVPLQDQVNLTTFSLKAAEWYSAFRQRWAVGWKGSETEKMAAAASQMWAFDEDPDRMRLGEFGQTDLRGFIESRGETMKFAATLSQTPVHELIGELVNLSAEALAAAEVGRDRMIGERKTGTSESHEQALALAVAYEGGELPTDAETLWRDTSARAFGAIVDGLGKIAAQLQVPPQELWSKIPGTSKQEVERWRKAWEDGDSIAQMNALLDQQIGAGTGGAGGESRTRSGIILPPGAQV